jgi:hypothetical protein
MLPLTAKADLEERSGAADGTVIFHTAGEQANECEENEERFATSIVHSHMSVVLMALISKRRELFGARQLCHRNPSNNPTVISGVSGH